MSNNIFYSDAGTGQAVVFLHGFCESHKLWNNIVPKLSHSFRIITIDMPGFGKTPLPENTFSLTDIATQIHDMLAGIGVQHPVIIGHSLGGYITLAYAKKFTGELKGFGLFHSSAYADVPEKKESRTKLIDFIEKNGIVPFLGTFFPSLFYENRREELGPIIKQLIEEAKSIAPRVVQEYARAMRDREENIELLKTFSRPIMMIIGENDQSVPLEKSLEQSRLIQRPYILRLKETAHMGMYERPIETFNFLHNFLNVC